MVNMRKVHDVSDQY